MMQQCETGMLPNRDVHSQPKILVVEDEIITARHLRRILLKLGYNVVGIAGDASAALDLIHQAVPDLVLADVGLEGDTDGIEVANRAREQWKIPTVFLTAYSDPATMRRARVTEPYGYLVKPFTEHELHATIEIALQQKDLAASRDEQVQVAAQILGRTQEELDTVTRRLFSAEDQERQRIARDLHDDIGQRLALLQIHLEKVWCKVPEPVREANEVEFKGVLGHIAILAKDLRNLSHNLHPQILDDLGLETALRELSHTFGDRHRITTRFSARDLPLDVPMPAAMALYRIVQQSLQNIATHAGADGVDVALIGSPRAIELTVRDNGRGFDARSEKQRKGIGLISMAQRAQLAGGDFEIQSHTNGGTQIHVRIPLESSDEQIADSVATVESR